MRTTRREFVRGAAVAVAAGPAVGRALAQGAADVELERRLANDPMRPQFHLLPAKNWMNDPNGPIYFNGRYHMFFQYNPHGATWGDMSWNHAVSEDMLHWRHLPLALTPTAGSADAYGCFSGSAIAVGQRVYVVYTGTRESTPELATIRDGENRIQESQCLAWSDDADLMRWTKEERPVVALPPAGMKVTGFRDPSAWRQGDWYYMTVGSGVAERGGCVLVYRSKDMKAWEYLHELTSGPWNGKKTANPCGDGEMWECPELFGVEGGHVLIYSTLGKVFWQAGVLDAETMKFTGKRTGVLDLGAYYAPKTQVDAKGRRILWGWIPERRPQEAMREAGWSGMMSLPRVLRLDEDGMLRMKIAPEVAGLRRGALEVKAAGDEASVKMARATGEAMCTGVKGKAFECVVKAGDAELVHVRYEPGRGVMMVDGDEVPMHGDDAPGLHVFVDGSVMEMMVNERVGCTKRFYYTEKIAPEIEVRMSGSGVKLEAWGIAPVSENRLTTPARG